ncbi:33949_t:CDS:1, partial [Gigaspora margarita]
ITRQTGRKDLHRRLQIMSYEELHQWATYMKSEDVHLRSMGEQKIFIVWNEFFPTDKSLL